MRATAEIPSDAQALVEAALRGELTEAEARRLLLCGEETATMAMLALVRRVAEFAERERRKADELAQLSGRIAELESKLNVAGSPAPSTPSGQVPVHLKPRAKGRRKKPGAKPGHPGARREIPKEIDRREEHRLKRCPCCGGKLQRCNRTRTRVIEDIPADARVEAVEHTVHRDYCPACKKHVEPAVPDALPRAAVGHRLVAMTCWLHYGLGMSIGQILNVLLHHLSSKLSGGALAGMWQRAAEILSAWYEQIAREALLSATLHADETGWRVNGATHWLWCFANGRVCHYVIDRSRGSPALRKFFAEAFQGTLVTDFWPAYDSVWAGDRQRCLAHLLRELDTVDERNGSAEWKAFAKKLRRLLRDPARWAGLRKRPGFEPSRYARRIRLIDKRLIVLATEPRSDKDAQRLSKRLWKHRDELFTFLDRPEVPYDNNLAERAIRPAVIMRKNCQGNRSERGASTQAILMSVYRTLKLRGRNPIDAIAAALREHVATGQLPPLPE